MSYYPYRWCVVPDCKNTSVKTPNKLWIQVPFDINRRKTWLQLARRDPKMLSEKSQLYFCEDHFDLENDMENYMEFKIMGSVKKIKMKPHCVPSRFEYQADKHQMDASIEPQIKRSRMSVDEETEQTFENYVHVHASSSHAEDYPVMDYDKAVQVLPEREHKATQFVSFQEHKAIQVCYKPHYRSKQVQTKVKHRDSITSPLKLTTTTATSPFKLSVDRSAKPSTSQSYVPRKLFVIDEKYDSDTSYTPSLTLKCMIFYFRAEKCFQAGIEVLIT